MLIPATFVLIFSIVYGISTGPGDPCTTGVNRHFKSTCHTFIFKSINHVYDSFETLHRPGTGAYRDHDRDGAGTSRNPMVPSIRRVRSTDVPAVSIDMVRGVSWPCSHCCAQSPPCLNGKAIKGGVPLRAGMEEVLMNLDLLGQLIVWLLLG